MHVCVSVVKMRALLPALLLSTALASAAQYKDVNKTVPLHPKGELVIDSHKGRIEVKTWDRPEVEIQARIQADGWTLNDEVVERTNVTIHVTQGSVRVKSENREDKTVHFFTFGSSTAEVIYKITMPRTAALRIKDHRSDVAVRDLNGAFDLDKHRGEARLERLSGPVTIKTHRADVWAGLMNVSGANRIETHRGQIHLEIPASSRFNIDADLGRHASIRSDFGMPSKDWRRSQQVRIPVNGGGATLRLKSERGDIVLRRI